MSSRSSPPHALAISSRSFARRQVPDDEHRARRSDLGPARQDRLHVSAVLLVRDAGYARHGSKHRSTFRKRRERNWLRRWPAACGLAIVEIWRAAAHRPGLDVAPATCRADEVLFQIAKTCVTPELRNQEISFEADVVPTPCAFGFDDRIRIARDIAERKRLDESIRARPLRKVFTR